MASAQTASTSIRPLTAPRTAGGSPSAPSPGRLLPIWQPCQWSYPVKTTLTEVWESWAAGESPCSASSAGARGRTGSSRRRGARGERPPSVECAGAAFPQRRQLAGRGAQGPVVHLLGVRHIRHRHAQRTSQGRVTASVAPRGRQPEVGRGDVQGADVLQSQLLADRGEVRAEVAAVDVEGQVGTRPAVERQADVAGGDRGASRHLGGERRAGPGTDQAQARRWRGRQPSSAWVRRT